MYIGFYVIYNEVSMENKVFNNKESFEKYSKYCELLDDEEFERNYKNSLFIKNLPNDLRKKVKKSGHFFLLWGLFLGAAILNEFFFDIIVGEGILYYLNFSLFAFSWLSFVSGWSLLLFSGTYFMPFWILGENFDGKNDDTINKYNDVSKKVDDLFIKLQNKDLLIELYFVYQELYENDFDVQWGENPDKQADEKENEIHIKFCNFFDLCEETFDFETDSYTRKELEKEIFYYIKKEEIESQHLILNI